MFAKLATAIPVGAVVTLALLFGMHSLIAMESFEVDHREPHKLGPFVRVKPNEELHRQEFHLPERPDFADPPPLPEASDPTDGMPRVRITRKPPLPTGPRDSQKISFMSDGPLITIVRVQPTYPAVAAQRGLEGFVIVEFDVFQDGAVGNVSVLESSSSIFERSAIQAVKRFRYKARVVDGEPLATSGVQYKFRFEMNH